MASTYLTRTAGSTSNRKTWTFSAWVKRSKISNADATQMLFGTYTDSNNRLEIGFHNANNLVFKEKSSSSTNIDFTSTQLFRDHSGWYHIVVAVDTTQSTNTNRVKIYVNGEQITAWDDSTYPAEDYDTLMNVSGRAYNVGQEGSNSYLFSGLMSHVHFVDGTAYTASTFGSTDSTTGEWKINTSPTLTMGTNGFTILKDGNTITDQSSNSNNFSSGGGTLTKTEDCPSNVFATLNPLANNNASSVLTNGNLTHTVSGNWLGEYSSLGAFAGKFYAEGKITDRMNYSFGVIQSGGDSVANISTANNNLIGKYTDGWGFCGNDGTTNKKRTNNSDTTYGEVFADNDIFMIAVDVTGGKIYFGRNGTWFDSSNPATGASPAFTGLTFTDSVHFASGMENGSLTWNFGNGYFGTTAISSEGSNASGIGKFEYDVPNGFTALSTKGLNE